MQRIETYKISDTLEIEALLSEMEKNFPIKIEAPIYQEQSFFDTFDWRLYNEGATIIKAGNAYALFSLKSEEIIQESNLKSKHQPGFWWDFPDGKLKNELKKSLDVRALLPLFSIKNKILNTRILNEDEKTVLRVQLKNISSINNQKIQENVNIINLVELKGYEKEFDKFKTYLAENDFIQEFFDIYLWALKIIDKAPGDYSSKLNIQLEPNMTARQAAITIFRFLLQVIKQNVEGIKKDIDTEFLHDFRVAIRRTRSALTQLKGILPKEIKSRFKIEFANLGKATNQMRDLDVYLLNKKYYQNMLPEFLQPNLDPLFEQLASERKKEHKSIVRALGSDSNLKLIDRWESFLNTDQENEKTKNSHKPIIDLAKKFISRQYDHVIKAGMDIQDDSPAIKLHQLRIECKKLRYLLEFFSSLFPREEISILVKQLKKLQDNLGDYNDLSVQQYSLKKYLETIMPENENSTGVAASIGGLISVLYQQQQSVRQSFARTFADFSSPSNAELYKKLFAR